MQGGGADTVAERVKFLCGTPASHPGVCGVESCLCFWSSSPLMSTLGSTGNGASIGLPVTCMEVLAPDYCRYLGSGSAEEDPLLFHK